MAQRGRSIPNRPVVKRPCVNRAPFRYGYALRPLATTWSKRFPMFRALFGRVKMPFSRKTCGKAIVQPAYSGYCITAVAYSGNATATPAYTGTAIVTCCEC